MPDDEATIAYCHSCGGPMDVSEVAPFSNVECPQCGKHTRVKREFGPYTLLRRHAIGGMSVVFVAHDNTLDREVALKILNEDYSADERRIEAFEEEARTTASISHPHVVRLLTTGRAFGRFYLAMELVSGGHFEHQIRERGTVPETEVLPLAIQVAEGLRAAHAAGLIHRDIKPGNILLDAAGNAKIVDFGLALVTKGGKAQATEIWATPYYVPPETIEGLEEDFRSDIYAFGATLYHALAGVPSCAEETMDTLKLREAKQSIRPLVPAIHNLAPETCAVVARAMAYDPADRFTSYDEMLAALRYSYQRVLAGPSEPAPDSATLRRRKAAVKDRERTLIIGAAVVLLAATGLAIHFINRKDPHKGTGTPLPAAGLEAIPQADPGSVQDPAIAAKIGMRYRSAREAMEKGEFERASQEFKQLRDDPQVQEPTGTWAGVEAVIATYLNGKPELAREEADLSARHATAANLPAPNVAGELIPALNRIRKLPAIPAKSLDSAKADAPQALAWMLCGLKDWEQGRLDDAAEFFKSITEAKLADQDAWARHYQTVAARYLADHKRLTEAEPKSFTGDKSTSQKTIDELEKVLATLETQGRARFNLREWQLMLKRRIHDLDHPVVKPKPVVGTTPVTLAQARGEVDQLCKDSLFAEAATRLKSLQPAEDEKITREALLALAESAASLLADLENDLGHGEVTLDLKSRDGATSYTKISASGPGKLKATDAAGTAQDIEWKDLAPESVIDLHRALVKNAKAEDVLRRHESAIAYDWLAGDRTRAASAADRLAVDSPAFKRRWDGITAGLK
ncbi:protein kinase [Luteolibacter ambystomatis]|uniref:Protein kinase n=1 Tax=Luteolibacter ambystomatis TaxID=2824561 RepID=A0A975J2V5_9BACT|nr:serine/threonine-protein kinase [Luteolibacter ambystomatis]QUE53009.1 protein kinase [Luteolibacter ambystomatis]